MMPKSWRIWMTAVPARLCSATTSSNCKSSIRLCSLMSASNGLKISSAISNVLSGCRGDWGGRSRGLGQFKFLQFRLDRHRVLRFGYYFLAGDHPGQVFFHQKTIERHHPVFRPGLDVRLDTE